MFSQKIIFIFIFEYPLRIISELIKIQVDILIKYYTDQHDVDEDNLTAVHYGGNPPRENGVGVMMRDMFNDPSTYIYHVASLKT